MMRILKRVLLSLVLLCAGALILLLSDLHSRVGARKPKGEGLSSFAVALLKHSSNPLLDEVERGLLDQLATAGYRDGERLALRRFSAEGDLPTATAKQMTDGSFKMALTISTLSLQCVANANRDGRAIHVFGAVTDPAGAGVGIQRMGSTNKPPWLAGIGTFQPVEQIFREAKRFWPGLQVVGVVWNPVERNSEACTLKAREVCRALGLRPLEANVDQSKDVREAADSLVARGVEAFWTGADVTVLNATAALCEVALKARIPVFSNNSDHVRDGTLFDLGANYFEVGQCMGSIASAILDGRDPATLVITNFMPERVMLNQQIRKKMRDPWRFTDDMIARAALIIGEDGRVEKEAAPAPRAAAPAPAERQYKIGLAYFGPDEGTDSAIAGLLDGLRQRGLAEGRNLTVQKMHANGEIGGIPAMLQALEASQVDVIVPLPPAVLAMRTAEKPAAATAKPALAKRWQIHQVSYMESVMVEDAVRGFHDGWKEAGLSEGTDFTLKTLSAQGDMATLGALFDSAKTAGTDLYVVYGTPTLQTAIRKVRGTPVVFTVVADAIAAGAGESDAKHLPNITGVYTQGPYREMAELLRLHFPRIKRVGTLFCPAEVNSVANKDLFVREAGRCGLTVETVPANSAGELSDAALALCGRSLDAVVQVVDNLSAAGFPAIASAASRAHLPVFACQGAAARQGAAVVLTRDYFAAGRETALMAARVMRGESPDRIPFSPPARTEKWVNLKKAQESRLNLPDALLREAKPVTDPSAP